MPELDEDGPVKCGYCGRRVRLAQAEYCWFCSGPLCGLCHDEIGHCGHQEAFRRDKELRLMLRRMVS